MKRPCNANTETIKEMVLKMRYVQNRITFGKTIAAGAARDSSIDALLALNKSLDTIRRKSIFTGS